MINLDEASRNLLAETLGDKSDDYVAGYTSALADAVELQRREYLVNLQSLSWLVEYATNVRGIKPPAS